MQAEMGVKALAPPAMVIFRAVTDQEQDTRGGETLDQRIKKYLRRFVDPVRILDHDEQGLLLAGIQQHALRRIEEPLAALERFDAVPLSIVDRDVQQDQKRWDQSQQGGVQVMQRGGERRADGLRIIMLFQRKIGSEEIADGERGDRTAVGDAPSLETPHVWPLSGRAHPELLTKLGEQ